MPGVRHVASNSVRDELHLGDFFKNVQHKIFLVGFLLRNSWINVTHIACIFIRGGFYKKQNNGAPFKGTA